MPVGEKQRPEAVVSVTAEDPEPPKKKKDKAEENLAQARKELKDNTELVRDLVSHGAGGRFTREATWRRRGLLRPSTRLTFAHSLQSEEDASLKAELEMLVERLSVRPRTGRAIGKETLDLISMSPSNQESDSNLHRPALESLRTLIRTSTSSMTSVPKPLKFLRPHYAQLQQIHASWPDHSPVQSTSAAIASTAAAAVDAVASAVGITKADAKGGDEAKQDGDAVLASVTDKGLFADILSVLAMTYADSGKRETLMYRLKGGSNEDPGLWGHEYVR